MELTILFPNGNNIGLLAWVLNFTKEVSLYELIHLSVYLDCQLEMKAPLRLLYWLYDFRNSQLVNNNVWIQAWHVLITSSRYIFVFWMNSSEMMLLTLYLLGRHLFADWLRRISSYYPSYTLFKIVMVLLEVEHLKKMLLLWDLKSFLLIPLSCCQVIFL